MTEDEKTISIRENPLYNYEHVVQKIISGKITKLVRRKQFENGTYRLKKQFSEKHSKLLDEYIIITNSKKILWVTLSNDQAQDILGATNPPIFYSYLNDLRMYWSKHEMSLYNLPYMWLHEIEYVRKPVQQKLEV